MKLAIGLMIPILLIVAGVLLLIGCLPIPATRQLQPNLEPKPESAIGTTPDKPIQLGRTRIDDAFIEISRRVQTRENIYQDWIDLPAVITKYPTVWLRYWRVSDDGRQFAVQYQVRTMTYIWPLCATYETEPRYLILTVNSNGIVTDQTTANTTAIGETSIERWLNVFDEPTRRKLQDAGVFPTDQQFQQMSGYIAPTTQSGKE
jgi:hypothetical protein